MNSAGNVRLTPVIWKLLLVLIMSFSLVGCGTGGSSGSGGADESDQDPDVTPAQVTTIQSGVGDSIGDAFTVTSSGSAVFTLSHDGIDNFIVDLRDETGDVVESLVNEIGLYEGSTEVSLDPGVYHLSVIADGTWTVTIDYYGEQGEAAISPDVKAILLTADSTSIGTNDTATITAKLLNASGQIITGSKTVVFTFDNPALAEISSSATTSSGIVVQTLTTKSIEGTVILTALADGISKQLSIEISDQLSADNITLTVSPSTITVGGTSVVTARVVDASGDPMPDGTTVNFSIDNDSLGSIVGSADVTGGAGSAQATFSANSTTSGIVNITASAGSISQTGSLVIQSAAAGNIKYLSATPQIISLVGSGGQETSVVSFLVEANGGPVIGSLEVEFTLNGPNGGEYIGPTAGVNTIIVGTQNGVAATTLHSGTIPGTATIVATVVGTNLRSSSGVIAIGGGVPSAGHFSLSSTILNLEGFAYDNIRSVVNVLIADRYGNFNVLEGTAVSFYSECGAIDRAVNLNAEGEGSVSFRTQTPDPQAVEPNIYDEAYEAEYREKLGVTFGEFIPRDGLCSVIAVIDGEEEFTDSNGNGFYDVGEPFTDSNDDIFMDMNDDPVHDPGFEDLVVDKNGSGTFDGENGLWDSNKRISSKHHILYTGQPTVTIGQKSVPAGPDGNEITSSDEITIGDNDSETVFFSLHDVNYNPPIAGSTITVSCDVGKISGTTSYDFLDTAAPGAPIFSFVISDDDVDPLINAEIGTLTFSWEWKGATYSTTRVVVIEP